MSRTARLVVLVVAAVAACVGRAEAVQGDLWGDVALVGGVPAARATFGLGEDQGRFDAGWAVDFVRRHGRSGDWSRTVDKLRRYLDALGTIESAMRLAPEGIRLPPVSATREASESFRLLAEALGLDVRRESKGLLVEPGSSPAARERATWVTAVGLDAADIAARWTAGEAVSLHVPVAHLPVPLPGFWVPRGRDTAASLPEVLRDRPSGLVYAGLIALDEQTLGWFDGHRDFLERVRDQSPGSFAAFAGILRIRDGAVDVPGGRPAWNAWQTVTGKSPADPTQFVMSVLTIDDGRLALFWDALFHAPASTAAAVVELGAKRPASLIAIYRMFRDATMGWSLETRPFDRPVSDPSWVMAIADMGGDTLTGPAWLPAVLDRVADVAEWPKTPGALPATLPAGDVEWLAHWLFDRPLTMVDHARLLRFARRLSGLNGASPADVEYALRAFQSFPALALALERLGIFDPAVIARVGTAAHVLSTSGDRNSLAPIVTRWQVALALLEQASRLRHLPTPQVATLVVALAETVNRPAQERSAAILRWVTDVLMPALAPNQPTTTLEAATLVRSIAGDVDATALRVTWDGLTYERSPLRIAMRDLDGLVLGDGARTLAESAASRPGKRSDPRGPAREDRILQAVVYALAMTPLHQPAALQAEAWSFHRLVPDSARGPDWWRPAWQLAIEDVRPGGGSALTGSWLTIDLVLAEAIVPRRFDQATVLSTAVRNAIFRDLAVRVHRPAPAATDVSGALAGLSRGRSVVAAWVRSPPPPDDVRRDMAAAWLGPTRTTLALWTLAHDPGQLASALTTTETIRLGGGQPLPIVSESFDGCICFMPFPSLASDDARPTWRFGVTAALANDSAPRIAEALAAMGLPVFLIDDLVPLVTADWLAHIDAYANDDWEALTLWPKRITRPEVEGYVLQLVAEGILSPVEEVVP